jgi:hypothetical protein
MIASCRCRALAVDLAKGDPESRALDGDRRRATRVSRVVGGDLMRRISRMVMGAAASAALLGGIGGAALAAVPMTGTAAATAIEYGTTHVVPVCNPTAIEYGIAGCSGT